MTPLNALTRRDFLKLISMSVTSLSLSGCVSSLEESSVSGKRPNILFIMSDDHAAPAVSAYRGFLSGVAKTPNLDRIAKEGMLFRNCFCTNSICAPSRAVILTGKYSHLNGVIDNRKKFDGSQQTFPKLLQKVGYQTAMIGKWHLKTDPTGFDYWNILPGQGTYYNPAMKEMGQRKKYTGYTTDIITNHCIKWLKERTSDKPFCLMYHHKAPHREWEPGPKHLTMYDDVTIPEPETLFDDYSDRGTAAKEQDMTIEKTMNNRDLKLVAPKNLTPEQKKLWDAAYEPKNQAFRKANLKGKDLVRWKYQRYIKDYLRCITSVDDNVGRVLNYLDEAGLANNTVVIYTSDQGFYLGEHGWFDKRFIYEESLRMPFLVRYPRQIKPGSVSDKIVLNLDFAPTFLDFAGAKIPADMQGQSLRSLLEGITPADWRASMYYHYYEYPAVHSVKRHYGIRTERYKLIHFYYDIDEWELYDLAKDPDELKNLYGDPSYAQVVKKLKAELARLKKEFGDTTDRYP